MAQHRSKMISIAVHGITDWDTWRRITLRIFQSIAGRAAHQSSSYRITFCSISYVELIAGLPLEKA